MASPGRPPTNHAHPMALVKAAMIWDEVEKAGLPGVKGVWCHTCSAVRLFNVISIEQLYPGHAKQAAMLAANCHSGNYAGRWTVVVDEDIDPSNLFDVIWAMSTRCEPPEDSDYSRRTWSTASSTVKWVPCVRVGRSASSTSSSEPAISPAVSSDISDASET